MVYLTQFKKTIKNKKNNMTKKIIAFIAGAIIFCAVNPASAALGDSKTYFGKIFYGDGKKALKAYLDMSQDFVQDSKGNFYIADTMNNIIRKINFKTSKVTKIAGNGDYGKINGSPDRATFGFPEGIAIDAQKNIYVADTSNNIIRKIDHGTNNVSTIVTDLRQPKDVMIKGNELFIADTNNNRILKTNFSGNNMSVVNSDILTPKKLAWNDNMLYIASEQLKGVIGLSLVSGQKITVFRNANNFGGIQVFENSLYVVESDNGVWNRLWKINLSNLKTKRLHKILETELLNYPSQVLIKEEKVKLKNKKNKILVPKIYILYNGGSSIYKFNKKGAKKSKLRIAGKHRYAQEMKKIKKAQAGRPKDIAIAQNKMYFTANNQVFVFNFLSQKLQHLAGHPMDSYKEGKGNKARLSDPTSIAITKDGKTLYVADRNNNRIRKIDTKTEKTSYITGAGEINSSNESRNGYAEGKACKNEMRKGIAGCAYFDRPTGIALSKDEKTLYIADASNNRVRKVDIATGQTSLIAGSGNEGYANGYNNQAQFRGPFTIAVSPSGNTLYIADKYNSAIRNINLDTNYVSTLAGGPSKSGYSEDYLIYARLSIPVYVKIGPDGNLYFTEAGNLRLRMINFDNQTTSLISGNGRRGFQNGSKNNTRFSNPNGFDFANKKIYLADYANDLVREISR